ncbi:unnamed protein product (macronuclear) [Paramecium tetraurelia]|uniref:CRC domain-containing protein n=1 Tax=Paramecium tetraurelia TaxID=5888 RepID=A0DBZ2_PARTE|nr:uncharacterized protein GSPATT00015436001 [Paramecium tetraurelia]CAK80559.1 unnamed protein product [Paramecium tetraurelia]|eukprot:XP_001447956.1 hypothetical protein (macronuclear) [Paramecium tetraurelia strain d4-2]
MLDDAHKQKLSKSVIGREEGLISKRIRSKEYERKTFNDIYFYDCNLNQQLFNRNQFKCVSMEIVDFCKNLTNLHCSNIQIYSHYIVINKNFLILLMFSLNYEPQIRKPSDATAIFQCYPIDQEFEQCSEDFPPPALLKYYNISEQQLFYNENMQDAIVQEQEFGISINSNQGIEKLQTTNFQQLEQSNTNIQSNNLKEKRNRRTTHYREFFDKDLDEHNLNNSPCKCSKSHCLKLYCACFHRNIECSELCQCHDCHNKSDYSQIRTQALEKVKVKQQRRKHDDDLFDKDTVWGCQCRKSQCKKNYCECFIRNKKCSSLCKCNNCENKRRVPNIKKIIKCEN